MISDGINKDLSLGLSSFKVCVLLCYIKQEKKGLLNYSLALKSYNTICMLARTLGQGCHSGYYTATLCIYTITPSTIMENVGYRKPPHYV